MSTMFIDNCLKSRASENPRGFSVLCVLPKLRTNPRSTLQPKLAAYLNEDAKKRKRDFFQLLPSFGILVFIGLYLYSAKLYPGGSQADLNSVGFDWVNNYWCNLMNENGMNGVGNPARPIAISAMIILCFSILVFFFQFAKYYVENSVWKAIIRVLGTLSMLCAVLIFTPFHDIMTTLSSVFGALVVVGIIRTIYQSDLTIFKISGLGCIALLAMNNYIYYSQNYIEYLPLIQKITFLLVLAWIIGLNMKMKHTR